MELRTARLTLRLARPDEAALVAGFTSRNREHLAPWEPVREPAWYTAAHWEGQLAAFAHEQSAGRNCRRHLFLDGRVIGASNLSNLVRGAFQSAQLGFALDQAAQGSGLMQEALEAVIAHAFSPDGLGLHRIEANHQPHNLRSAALLRRLAFEPQGFARDYLFLAGAWRDHVLTARLNPAWQPR